MLKQQALHCKAEEAGANMKCRSSRRYSVMQKQQVQHCDTEARGATL
jgi:hypothetical protein